MFTMNEDEDLLEYNNKYNDIWDKASYSMEKDFDSKLLYNKKFLKTKIKIL